MTSRTDTLPRDLLTYLVADARRKLSRKKTPNDYVKTVDDLFQSLEQTIAEERSWPLPRVHELYIRCHDAYGLLGGALTADHWQSPSFAYSGMSEAGDEGRSILANVNDYKRDMHAFGRELETRYKTAYAKKHIFSPVTLATSSGMAALTVSLILSKSHMGADCMIALGEHSYFENKELVHMLFAKNRITVFDEYHPETLRNTSASIVLIDSVANDPALTVPDMHAFYRELSRIPRRPFLLVDASASSILDIDLPSLSANRFRLVVFESLNKYHQFGLDRVTGGMITAYGVPFDDIYRVRDHAGTNISESAAATIPTPNGSLLKRYLARLRENATRYQQILETVKGISVKTAGANGRMLGSIVSVELPEKKSGTYRKIIKRTIALAQKNKVPLLAGTTFGTPVTRLYTWSTRSEFERPFLRISPGLEDDESAKRTAALIVQAIRSVLT